LLTPTPPPPLLRLCPRSLHRHQQQESQQQPADGRAAVYDDHEDSVYGLAWSAADPWLFGSMSHDGRVTLHRVPKGIKYKVLI
jgi:WD40 repeat protein